MGKYLKPINKKIEEIKKVHSNGIYLVGGAGSGKTTTLLEYVNQSKKTLNPVIDITLLSNSCVISGEYARLYQVCNIIQKMLLYIKDNYLRCYVEHFLLFHTKITNIQKEIITMYNLGNYKIGNNKQIFLDYPEILLEDFLNITIKYLKYDSLTVVLDNFDIEKPYMYLYQTYIYQMLKQHLRVVATISDPFIINEQDKLNLLAENNSLIMINYNKKVDVIKRILDEFFSQVQDKKILSRQISFMFNDATIEKLIVQTNGNIHTMILIMSIFLQNINKINFLDYDKFLLKIMKDNIYLNNTLIENQKIRKLYL